MTIIALAVVGVAVAAIVHLTMLFLNNAPLNSFSQQHAAAIDKYLVPEFSQGWQLYAPNPKSVNTHVQARAKVKMPSGSLTDTGWVDLTAMDDERIVHNPLPSQAHQNELHAVWNNYVDSLDNEGRPVGLFGKLMQQYLLRIVAHRLGPQVDGGTVQFIQLRSADTPVGRPPWSLQQTDTQTSYVVQPWWAVKAEDFK
ncbi:DUF5819 family protein [Streptomyces sp. NPDC017179]|uniref:DUF5819 family protein n=1 Tax=Streptomyces sp. NPDC017179 TaxID=3364979 RepID=UPI0037A13B1B